MQIIQNRRDFLASAVRRPGRGRPRRSGARSPTRAPPETTTVRLVKSSASASRRSIWPRSCCARKASPRSAMCRMPVAPAKMIGAGERDFGLNFAPSLIFHQDAGEPITALAGVHPGCFELFAHEPIRSISDLKGKTVGVPTGSARARTCSWPSWRPMSGSTRRRTSTGSRARSSDAMELFAEGKIDAFLASPPEPQELRARKIGHVILNTTTDQPWSQYFCCMLAGNADFVRQLSGRDQARAARHPQGRRPLRRRAGAGRAATGRWRVHRPTTTTRSRRSTRSALRQLARVRPRGHAAVLRAAPARGRA